MNNGLYTIHDFFAQPNDRRAELIDTLQKDNAEDGKSVYGYPFPEIHSLKEAIPVIISDRKLMIDLRAEAERRRDR